MAEKTQSVIRHFKDCLNIKYYSCPKMNEPQTSAFLVSKTDTPFVAFLADDDFLIPSGLERCVSFLETNPDYSVAHGLALMVVLKDTHDEVEVVGYHGGVRNVPNHTAAGRFFHILGQYSPLAFGVHRTEQMNEIYSHIGRMPDKGIAEFFISSFSALQGKIKNIDSLYLVRTHHDGRHAVMNVYDWLFTKDWLASQEIYVQELTKKMMASDGLSEGDALEIVKRGMLTYLMAVTLHSKNDRQHRIHPWRKRLTSIRLIRKTGRWVRSLLPGQEFCLQSLLRSSSKYHSDFMPIYESIVEKLSFLQ